jgi:hypothetical protein
MANYTVNQNVFIEKLSTVFTFLIMLIKFKQKIIARIGVPYIAIKIKNIAANPLLLFIFAPCYCSKTTSIAHRNDHSGFPKKVGFRFQKGHSSSSKLPVS